MVVCIAGSGYVTGCSSNGDDPEPQAADPDSDGVPSGDDQPIGAGVAAFDGTWLSACRESGTFGASPEDEPEQYARSTLVIDSGAGTYSDRMRLYTDPGCSTEDPSAAGPRSSGRIEFDGTTTTSSGLEAAVVRYTSDGTSPDLVGLLYRDGDVLYRERRESTLIEDVVPTELALSNPWRQAD